VDFLIAQDKLSKGLSALDSTKYFGDHPNNRLQQTEQKAVNITRGKQRGIVRSIKSNYGFIERYDKLAKEQLFFHLSEVGILT